MRPVFAALGTGGIPAARAELDKVWPAAAKNAIDVRQRWAVLAFLGDGEGLHRELAARGGEGIRWRALAEPVGWIGLAWLGHDAADASKQSNDVANRFTAESSTTTKNMAKAAKAMAAIAQALAGGDIDVMAKGAPLLRQA